MNPVTVLEMAGGGIAAAGAGLLTGLCHFASLRMNTRLFTAGRSAMAFGLQGVRLGLSAAVLFMLVHLGAFALLSGMLGWLLARPIALRRWGAQQ